ncbi:hypothetical protein BJX99DRAFT_256330 [Aspergillus californicus]
MQSSYYTQTTAHIDTQASVAVDELITHYFSSMFTTTSVDPLGKSRRNVFRRATDRVRLEYYRYEVTFGLYVMTPAEKLIANSFVMVVLGLLFWASLVYFPALLYQKLSRLIWLLTGHNSGEMGAAFGIMESHGSKLPRFIAEMPLL